MGDSGVSLVMANKRHIIKPFLIHPCSPVPADRIRTRVINQDSKLWFLAKSIPQLFKGSKQQTAKILPQKPWIRFFIYRQPLQNDMAKCTSRLRKRVENIGCGAGGAIQNRTPLTVPFFNRVVSRGITKSATIRNKKQQNGNIHVKIITKLSFIRAHLPAFPMPIFLISISPWSPWSRW